ncbi:MAG TPA: lysylphosphatidylglycerol synthase transmembrane domain-containing protein [Alphaproteobacteria bacterium]
MWKLLAKVGVSALLIWLLLRGQDVGALWHQLLAVERVHLIAAATALWLLAIPSALRWSKILEAMGKPLGLRATFPLVLIGLFFNLTLPSSFGGDAVRMWKANRIGLPAATAVLSVMVDRITALAALLLLVLAALPLFFARVADFRAEIGVLLLLGIGFLGFAVAMALDKLPVSLQRFRLVRGIVQLSAELRKVLLVPSRAAPTLFYSLVNQGGAIIVVAVLAKGLGLSVSWSDCLVIVPLAILATVIPISVAGWGVREQAFVTGFGLLGVPAGGALTLSVLFGLVNTAVSLPGGLVWLASSDRRAGKNRMNIGMDSE